MSGRDQEPDRRQNDPKFAEKLKDIVGLYVETGGRPWKNAEVDHRVPLFRV